uniref:Pti1 n=1 Tax=Arundo donax TaxID=35708 RepID=A0A0A9AEG8_ARUDO
MYSTSQREGDTTAAEQAFLISDSTATLHEIQAGQHTWSHTR